MGKPSKKILVTGGAGFIGTNYLYWLFENESDFEVVNIDYLQVNYYKRKLKENKKLAFIQS